VNKFTWSVYFLFVQAVSFLESLSEYIFFLVGSLRFGILRQWILSENCF